MKRATDLVNPTLNLSRKPWDDWTKWYPEESIAPGLHAEDKIDAASEGDLKGLFFTDELNTNLPFAVVVRKGDISKKSLEFCAYISAALTIQPR